MATVYIVLISITKVVKFWCPIVLRSMASPDWSVFVITVHTKFVGAKLGAHITVFVKQKLLFNPSEIDIVYNLLSLL